MQPETQQHRYQLLKSAVTAATTTYAAALLDSTNMSHYVGNTVLRDYLTRLDEQRQSALAELDAFCATDDTTQP